MTYNAWEMEQDWGQGFGPRDCMRAGWEKDVGDVEYILGAYKDPSTDPFSWWYATIAAKIVAEIKNKMQGFGAKIFVMFLASKMISVVSKMVKIVPFDDFTMKIFAIGVLTKMCWTTTKIGFTAGKMFGRIAKMEYSLTAKGGNSK